MSEAQIYHGIVINLKWIAMENYNKQLFIKASITLQKLQRSSNHLGKKKETHQFFKYGLF